jgi:hypothetical protein
VLEKTAIDTRIDLTDENVNEVRRDKLDRQQFYEHNKHIDAQLKAATASIQALTKLV